MTDTEKNLGDSVLPEKEEDLDQEDLDETQDSEDEDSDDEDHTDTEDDEETETDDNDEESEEESDSEELSDKSKDHSKDKVHKRINQLTGRNKELQERLNQAESELKDSREDVEYLQGQLEREATKARKGVKDWTWQQESILDMNPKDFRKAVREMAASGVDTAKIDQAEEAYESYQEKLQPLREQAAQLEGKSGALWSQEWQAVESALLDKSSGNPALSEYLPQLNEHLQREAKKDPLLVPLLNRGVRQKFKWALEALDNLGISSEVEKLANQKNRPDVEAPTGVGKRRKSKSAKAPSFTRKQIDDMSDAEYEKHEKAIDAAMAAGRIR